MNYSDLLADISHALADDRHAVPGMVLRDNLAIYRNNVKVNRVAALADAFTNVVMLVGTDYFRALARAYVDAVPATSANLHDDGGALPAFICDFAPARELPYLADVAQADWLLHRAYFADDATLLEPAALASLDVRRLANATLRLMPSVGVARSARWPIADILAMNADGSDARVDAGAQSVLVWRANQVVRWAPLDPANAEFVDALLHGSSVATALQISGATPDRMLAQLFRDRLVMSVEEKQT
ncbi:hypothetical protein WI25_37520 [Burkholderia cepacia]|uniref:HvfC/BufC N-terminal domain-containing protein n=1 Tax=Burkholderia cepacia TaxID=292 RepID=UPI000759FCA9|nr:DNA-binding domain-containing protein [Burkholderia cepacia]KUY80978.1 hypothetical protein WI25_37520 [Burkholderia cepacia]